MESGVDVGTAREKTSSEVRKWHVVTNRYDIRHRSKVPGHVDDSE